MSDADLLEAWQTLQNCGSEDPEWKPARDTVWTFIMSDELLRRVKWRPKYSSTSRPTDEPGPRGVEGEQGTSSVEIELSGVLEQQQLEFAEKVARDTADRDSMIGNSYRIDDPTALKVYLARCITNRCRDRYRRISREEKARYKPSKPGQRPEQPAIVSDAHGQHLALIYGEVSNRYISWLSDPDQHDRPVQKRRIASDEQLLELDARLLRGELSYNAALIELNPRADDSSVRTRLQKKLSRARARLTDWYFSNEDELDGRDAGEGKITSESVREAVDILKRKRYFKSNKRLS